MLAFLPADWPAPQNVRAVTTLRYGAGISPPPFDSFNLGGSEDSPDNIAQNRAELMARLKLPSAPCWLQQVHGTQVQRFDAPGLLQAAASTADAAVTSTQGVVLAVLTADCLPVVLASRDGAEIAAAHAGWRGLAAGILECTIKAMHTRAADIIAWMGPAAGPLRYEIGQEVFRAFIDHDARAKRAFIATRPGHWRVDLYALARQRLLAAGLAAADIHGGHWCTICEPERFYSHRRDARSGRLATLIWQSG